MIYLGCSAARRNLPLLHDGELPIDEQIVIRAHLAMCPSCAMEAERMEAIREAVRAGAALRIHHEDLVGMQAGVVSRMKAERYESLFSRVGRMFEDMHLVWSGVGATAAAVACVTIVIGMLASAPTARPDSLAALLSVMASPGSDLNPVRPVLNQAIMLLPRALPDAAVSAAEMNDTRNSDAVVALSAVVTREGRVANLRPLSSSDSEMVNLLDTVSRARFEPGRSGGSPVAVNMIWLIARTTVRGNIRGPAPAPITGKPSVSALPVALPSASDSSTT
jgi:anti-sigma factor RsiW